jgi:RecB family exonuclease
MSTWLPVYSPTKLNMYRRCPHSYWRRYIARSMPEVPPGPALIRGMVTHQILNLSLGGFQAGAGLPDDVSDMARTLVGKYPQLLPGQAEIEIVQTTDMATYALDHFDVTCEVIMVEDNVEHLQEGRFRLMARADVILRHADGTYEVIDWKTGASDFQDSLQYLILYVGALSRLKADYGVMADAVRVTVANLRLKQYTSIDTSRETSLPVWANIKKLIRAIETDRTWKPRQNRLCPYCPLYDNGCPLEGPNYLDLDA